MSRVIAVKGVGGIKPLIGATSAVEITARGKRRQRGYKVWPVCGDTAKAELYGWLGLERTEGEPLPPGWCNFPEYAEEYFLELTSEHLVPIRKRGKRTAYEWRVIPGRENHGLDCRVYARAAASVKGLDRAKPPPPGGGKPPKSSPKSPPDSGRKEGAEPRAKRGPGKKDSWLKGGGKGRGSFLKKRR